MGSSTVVPSAALACAALVPQQVWAAGNCSLVRFWLASTRNWASARMWRRYSSGERHILHFLEDVWPEKRAQGFDRDQLHAALESILKKQGKVQETVEGLPPRLECYEDVHIAIRPALVADE
jgi:hypothetical protein